jgi:UDP-N-acetylglucosamine 1-carboxyvinyltransferase
MEKLVVEGGTPLSGTIEISGAKNAVLPIMAATLLGDGHFTLTNVPDLQDVHTMKRLFRELGADTEFNEGTLEIASDQVTRHDAPYELVKKMRASVLVLGPLLARFGEARVSLPGGCAIGSRPIDIHLSGLESLGAEVEIDHGDVTARAEQLTGAEIYMDFPSVGATQNIMMAAAMADGETVLENPAREPEIVCVQRVINKMGGDIEGAGTEEIRIRGTRDLSGTSHRVIPDRIETGTYLAAGAMTEGDVTVTDTNPDLLQSVLSKFRESGNTVETTEDTITIRRDGPLDSTDAVTMPYPGFPTDMQAQFMATMCLADGTSAIKETIFEDRFTHVLELERLGADIKIDGNTAIVTGVDQLEGAPVMASDLRASAALIVAGLAAEGKTDVRRLYHLDRGYENLEQKLRQLGATVERREAEGP